jgi:folate-dependent phosphoribosylglycinamide formyltransferase PurN
MANIFRFVQPFYKFLLHICQMFEKLKQHWKVNGLNLILIISTFALGGSLCGYAGRKLLALTNMDKGFLWVVLYILLVTLLWPVAVLLVSIPLGQFLFFKKYIGKVLGRFKPKPHLSSPPTGGREMEETLAESGANGRYANVAIFASGGGSNAEQIIKTSLPSLLQKERGEVENVAGSSANAKPINVAIFASGDGSNAKQIITLSQPPLSPPKGEEMEKILVETLANSNEKKAVNYKVVLVVCNKPGAGVLEVAAKAGIPYLLIEKERFFNGDNYISELQQCHIDFIALAGFLWKLPEALIKAYPKKIINIHPALLPKYGGKGMFGCHVHEAVINNKEKQSGITIHYVDELYDHGEIIFQATCAVDENDTAETLAKKVQGLEHEHYARVIGGVVVSV